MDTDRLVYEIREMARLADSAGGVWKPTTIVHDAESGDVEDCYPDNDRQVLVFLNGHVDIGDMEGRKGGGWGIRLGHFDHDRWRWRAGDSSSVTHWMELPPPPKKTA
jgi:hypothetical protein